ELLSRTQELVEKEKNYTLAILKHLKENEHRKLYGDLGYSSLHAYCVHFLKYSDTETHYRIQAMRLMKDSAVIEEKIAKGELNLVVAGTLQDHLRGKEKQGEKVSLQQKEKLVQIHAGLSVRDLRIKLNESTPTKKFKITVDQQTAQRFEEFRKNIGGYSDQEIINHLFDYYLKAEKKAQEKAEQKKNGLAIRAISKNPQAQAAKHSRYIPARIKGQIKERAHGQCEYVSPITGRRCEEKRYLELHHVDPFAFNGTGDVTNLKIFCSLHNKRQAIVDFGQQKMDLYLDSR
ncbi:MAG: hypothetical protein WCG27_10735, partial [Pseudomonadota bacterium]